jgi:hypothetical protein
MVDRIQVVIDYPAFPGEVEAVEETFEGLDADVTVEPKYETRSAGIVPWIVLVSVSGVAIFFKKLTELAAEDTYTALKRWVGSVAAARRRFRSATGTIQVRDARISRIVLHDDLPDEAFIALLEIDLDALPDSSYLVWDGDQWKSV